MQMFFAWEFAPCKTSPMSSPWIAALFITIAGAYSVGTVGITGGPNHREHPFTVTIVHAVAFYFLSKTWPAPSRELYWGGLACALVLAAVAMRLTHGEKTSRRPWVRVPLGLLYAGFLLILFKRP